MDRDFYCVLDSLLTTTDFKVFCENFLTCYENFKSNYYTLENTCIPKDSKEFKLQHSFKDLKILHPTRIRRPKFANTPLSVAKIIHSVAHIEFSAIILALDACYRFRGLDREYYNDWLEVAFEEVSHFKLLCEILEEIGYEYGDFSVHFNLLDAMEATQQSLSVRMGVVHRGLEARGLDANPFVLKKLLETSLPIKTKIQEVFNVILRDEISHVSKGDKWWRYAKQMDREGESASFLKLCKNYKDFILAGRVLNTQARLQAGFSKEELQELEKFYNSAKNPHIEIT